jgi:hypothetical protein
MSRPTGHANRDLWQLHEDVAFGRAGGQVIWQPRILAWFTDKYFEKEPLPTPYTHMAEPEIYVTFTEDELAACAEKVIALFAPKPILGASDEVSSHGEIERVRLVGRIVDDFNAHIAARMGPGASA